MVAVRSTSARPRPTVRSPCTPLLLLLACACGPESDAAPGAPADPADAATAAAGQPADTSAVARTEPRRSPPSFSLQPFRDADGALDSLWVTSGGRRVQTLAAVAEDAEPPPEGAEDFGREDVDFDGVPDVWHRVVSGATGNAIYDWWLYDPAQGAFRHSPEFSEKVGAHTLDPARRRITVRSNGGHAGAIFTEAVYEVRDGRLEEVSSVDQDWLPEADRYVRRTRVRRGERLEERVDTLRLEDLPAPGSE